MNRFSKSNFPIFDEEVTLDWTAISITLQLASATTLILFVVGIPLAYWLAMSRGRGRFLIEAIVALPLVLPPTVLGYYLLARWDRAVRLVDARKAFLALVCPFPLRGS